MGVPVAMMSASTSTLQRAGRVHDHHHDDELLAEELTHVPSDRDGIEYVERARAAGAEGELRYLGAGMQGYVFADARGHAYKVARFDTPSSHRLLSTEYQWLHDANAVPEIRRHVAKVYAFYPELGVLEREEVVGDPMRSWSEESRLRPIHEKIEEALKDRWTAPEFKGDSYVRTSSGPVLVDAGFALRRGVLLVNQALAKLKGEDVGETAEDLAFAVRMEAGRTIDPVTAEQIATQLEQFPHERRANPVGRRRPTEENAAALAALEAARSRVDAERAALLYRFLPEIEGESQISQRRRFHALDDAGGVPDWYWDADALLGVESDRLFHEIWDLRKASGLDPRTGKPPERQKPRPTIADEGHYPELLGEPSHLFSGCDDPRVVARRRTADGHMEHLECPRNHHHLRYLLDDGTPVAGLTLSSDAKKKRAVIDMVYTDPAHRRHGYAAALLAFARERYTVKHSKTLTDQGKVWARSVNPTTLGNELILWHGGRPWQGPVEVQRGPIRANQHGAGVYLTTSAETARKYAKGGGRVFRFALDPSLVLLDEQRLPVAEMVRWLKDQPRMRNRDKVIHDLHRLAGERSTDALPIFMLSNLFVNHDAHGGAHGVAFARWMSRLGIDAELVMPPGKSGEDWIVLFNPEKVISVRPASPAELADMPRVRR